MYIFTRDCMMFPICIWCATLKSGKYVFLFKGLSFIGTENICKHFLTVILQCSVYNHSHWSTYNVIEHQILFFICNWISFQWINLSVISIVLLKWNVTDHLMTNLISWCCFSLNTILDFVLFSELVKLACH